MIKLGSNSGDRLLPIAKNNYVVFMLKDLPESSCSSAIKVLCYVVQPNHPLPTGKIKKKYTLEMSHFIISNLPNSTWEKIENAKSMHNAPATYKVHFL